MELAVFKHNGAALSALMIDGQPWFVAKEVCDALGYGNSREALRKHVPEKHKGVTKRDTLGGAQEMTVIDESGLYRLILRSRVAGAEVFMDWVTEEVLPSLRKHGIYITGQSLRASKKEIIALCKKLKSHLIYEDEVKISKKFGFSDFHISQILKGQSVPDPKLLQELCEVAMRNKERALDTHSDKFVKRMLLTL